MSSNDVLNQSSSADNPQTNSSGNSRHVCPKCESQKTVTSRPQGGDKWLMRLLPKSPYRCLRCYHRFWKAEPFFANTTRVWTWMILLLGLIFLLFTKLSPTENQALINDAEQPVQTSIVSLDSDNQQTTEQQVKSKVQPINAESDGDVNVAQNGFGESRVREVTQRDQPQTLSPEQLEQQIAVAKQQAEQAKRDNEARQRRLKKSLSSAEDELQSLLKLDISYEIDQWKRAWEAGDSERYLSFYSRSFIPANGVSNKVWQARRRKRVTPAKKVTLNLSDYQVTFSNKNTQSTVTFNQDYLSDNYSDMIRKRLVLRKEWQRWKIISETEVN